jgi:hypothetical protein
MKGLRRCVNAAARPSGNDLPPVAFRPRKYRAFSASHKMNLPEQIQINASLVYGEMARFAI